MWERGFGLHRNSTFLLSMQANPTATEETPFGPDKTLVAGQLKESKGGRDSVGIGSSLGGALLAGQHHSVIQYEGIRRLAIMVTPTCDGDIRDQTWEAISMMRAILREQGEPMTLTMQTVFVADAADVPAIQKLFEAYFDEQMPLTLFAVQPPCDGAALAVEAWAISTSTVAVGYHGPHLVTIEHDGLRWIYASAGAIHLNGKSAYEQAAEAFGNLGARLSAVGVPFRDVQRLWLYQGGITESENSIERYRELNRARTDFFRDIDFGANPLLDNPKGGEVYPASTGIGTDEHGLVITSLSVQTDRDDVRVLSLENPQQTSACDYPAEYSAKSPKFSRATAVRMGDHMTTWISGTASIVNSETVFPGDVERQTEQTLDNIENLISHENFARLGWGDAGATLDDLAKVRVYVKYPEDYEKCRAVCEKRLGQVPSVYATASVCRPDLLVEIEGVAFSELPSAETLSDP